MHGDLKLLPMRESEFCRIITHDLFCMLTFDIFQSISHGKWKTRSKCHSRFFFICFFFKFYLSFSVCDVMLWTHVRITTQWRTTTSSSATAAWSSTTTTSSWSSAATAARSTTTTWLSWSTRSAATPTISATRAWSFRSSASKRTTAGAWSPSLTTSLLTKCWLGYLLNNNIQWN